jgi:hypothetical protein
MHVCMYVRICVYVCITCVCVRLCVLTYRDEAWQTPDSRKECLMYTVRNILMPNMYVCMYV